MRSDAKLRLGDVCSKIGSGATPRGGKKAYQGGNFALVRSQNVHNQGFEHDGLAYINDQQAEILSNVELERDDVLLNITGDSVARCCQVDPDVLPARVNQHVAILRTDPEQLDAQFLRYKLVSPEMQHYLLTIASAGGTRNALTKGFLEDLEIDARPLPEQQAIARILGALDDKIKLNRQMNQTLEAIARALFKSWFVDFDPVHANAAGNPTLPPDIANLFPADFETSEVGPIPKEWRVWKLTNLADVISGGTPKKSKPTFWNGDLPWVSPKSMNAIHVFDTMQHVTKDAVGSGTREVTAGTVFVMVRGMGLHEGVRISQARRRMTFNQDVKAIVPREIDSTLLLFALLNAQPTLHNHVRSSGHGTGVLPTEAVSELRLVVPPTNLSALLTSQISCINEQIALNEDESRTLASLQKSLLPKLFSGEIKPSNGAIRGHS